MIDLLYKDFLGFSNNTFLTNDFLSKCRGAESLDDEEDNPYWHYEKYINFPNDYKDLVMFDNNNVYIIEGQWNEPTGLAKIGLLGIRVR